MDNWLKTRIAGFRYAFLGIAALFKEEPNACIHLAVAIVAIFLGFFLNISSGEWLAVVICIGLVFSMEALNSAVENLSDFSTKEKHPLIKKTKDLAAAAVLVSAMASLIVGAIVFLPKLIAFL